jgi:biopolymer transport protein ExbD
MLPASKVSLRRRRAPAEEAEMDITPMIDCTFLLLIFFIVTSKMTADTPIELPIAKHGGAVVVKESVIITVAKGEGTNAAIYKGDNTDAANLLPGDNLQAQEDAITEYIEQESAVASPPKRFVLIKGAKGVKHGDVARVAQAASKAEVEQLYVAVLEVQ